MLIESLTLRYFRNYKETTIQFATGGAYITGANGSGKTNLLEAIYYLANHVSFRTSRIACRNHGVDDRFLNGFDRSVKQR